MTGTAASAQAQMQAQAMARATAQAQMQAMARATLGRGSFSPASLQAQQQLAHQLDLQNQAGAVATPVAPQEAAQQGAMQSAQQEAMQSQGRQAQSTYMRLAHSLAQHAIAPRFGTPILSGGGRIGFGGQGRGTRYGAPAPRRPQADQNMGGALNY